MTDAKKFYQLSPDERLSVLIDEGLLVVDDLPIFTGESGLSSALADRMVENVIGTYTLPLGIARNFLMNRHEYTIPMVTEEPSVIAAASNGAKIVAQNGGFDADVDDPIMIGQVQLVDVPDMVKAENAILAEKEALLDALKQLDPIVQSLGGGPRDLRVTHYYHRCTNVMIVVYLEMDVRDAMGANAINSALEFLAPKLEALTDGKALLRILSNLADRRLARAQCHIAPEFLRIANFSGDEVVNRIIQAGALAEVDPYRAVTHNKGIMNGVDAVAIATGNDWRALEAGAHGWAARTGVIQPLTRWTKDEHGFLCGAIELPLAVGTVGGATRVHPTAKASLRLLNVQSACELAMVMASVGLAQNFAALRALATEGIQRGHMTLHARQVAIAAGAEGDAIGRVAREMCESGVIRLDRAKEILNQ